jgi:hypothetical protein
MDDGTTAAVLAALDELWAAPCPIPSRTTAEFQSDRGRRLLPAYQVEIEDAIDPAYVLDPEVEAAAWWPQDLTPELRGLEGGSSAQLQDDGRTIPLAAAEHPVVVTLAAPLGARVLVHPSGFPLTVERA